MFASRSLGRWMALALLIGLSGPVGLAQLVLRLAGGLHERTLVLILIGLEALCGLAAVLLYRLL